MSRTTLSSQFSREQIKSCQAHIVARNTFKRIEPNGDVVIRLHSTDIVTTKPDGKIVLNSGGWKSVTTKARINCYLPEGYRLYQEKGSWYVNGVPFVDGMTLPDDVINLDKNAIKTVVEAEQKLRKSIRDFVKQIRTMKELPVPMNSDCWFCALRTAGKGEPLGEATGNVDHLLSHIKEAYLHGSLIYNALVWAGYPKPELFWQIPGSLDLVQNAVKRYLYRKLGLVA